MASRGTFAAIASWTPVEPMAFTPMAGCGGVEGREGEGGHGTFAVIAAWTHMDRGRVTSAPWED